MANETIRQEARAAGVCLWQIALAIGISEPTLTRWMRTPLPEDKEKTVLAAIKQLEVKDYAGEQSN